MPFAASATTTATAATGSVGFSKVVDGFGTITVTAGATGGEICQRVILGLGGNTEGCFEAATFQTGQAYSEIGVHGEHVLFGLAPIDLELTVTVGARIITPDPDGLWWTDLEPTDTSFTIQTPTATHVMALSGESPATTSPIAVLDPAQAGDPAMWNLDPNDPPTASASSFTARVMRLDCSGGRTGAVFEPDIEFGTGAITVTFVVAPLDPRVMQGCPSNDEVAYTVQLDEPIGSRRLVDGACRPGAPATATLRCGDNGTRWTP